MHRSRQKGSSSRKQFVKRAGKTMKLNTTHPMRGGIRL